MKEAEISRNEPSSWPFILTTKQVQQITGIGRNKLLDMLQTGELPCKRVRGRWFINRDALLNWLAS